MASTRVFLFGDQTVEKITAIRNLRKAARTSLALQRFLQDASSLVQEESTKLGPAARKSFSTFDNIFVIAEQDELRKENNAVIQTTAVTILRLGELILLV